MIRFNAMMPQKKFWFFSYTDENGFVWIRQRFEATEKKAKHKMSNLTKGCELHGGYNTWDDMSKEIRKIIEKRDALILERKG